MAKQISSQKSIKHTIVAKDNTTIFAAIAISVFLVVFCALATKSLLSQSLFQKRVISEQKKALSVLNQNKKIADELAVSYRSFATEPVNVIGGSPNGTGPKDGDNGKIILDALPSEYDFPGLSSSIEKILIDGSYNFKSIEGSEDPTQQLPVGEATVALTKPVPIEIPYSVRVEASSEDTIKLLKTFENSIRPIYVTAMKIDAVDGNKLSSQIDLKTFYLPATGLEITKKEIK